MAEPHEEAIRVVRCEAAGLEALAETLAQPEHAKAFSDALDLVVKAEGYLVVVGVGKSGHIAQKLAASFASTGTPAFFMHPTEASHGDLGMLTPASVVLAISNSGESRELVDVLHYCRKAGIPVIGLTRSAASSLGEASTVVLELPEAEEACPNRLAPTTSTTLALAMGDALVVAAMRAKGVTRTDFGNRHPGGKLGRELHTVEDWMRLHPEDVPTVEASASAADVVSAVSEGQQGCVAVIEDGRFVGMITDGDLRRALEPGFFDRTAADMMTADPVTFSPSQAMGQVVETMRERKLGNGFVVNDGKPVAVLNIKSLLIQGYA